MKKIFGKRHPDWSSFIDLPRVFLIFHDTERFNNLKKVMQSNR